MTSLASENLFAGLDIGSHTTRMLIAEKSGAELVVVRAERRVTRLAQGFLRSGEISGEAEHRNLEALKEYAAILGGCGVRKISCGATGVVRRAANSAEVLGRIAAETGFECRILSEQTEAWLSAKGIQSAIDLRGKTPLMFDVGGGSTEFVLPVEQNQVVSASRPVGAATLSETYLGADPPGLEALKAADVHARGQIDSARVELYESSRKRGRIVFPGGLLVVGTAGTVTTLAAINLQMKRYVPYRVNGLALTREWLCRTIGSLALMPLVERRAIAGLEAGREDIILGGAVIVSQILTSFGTDSFIVSEAGLIEGLAIELAEREEALAGAVFAAPTTHLTWRRPKR